MPDQPTRFLHPLLNGATKVRFEITVASIPPVAQALLALWFRLDLPICRRYNPRT
jgi:hypothetical protein